MTENHSISNPVRTGESFFSVLWRCAVTSLLLLGGATVLHLPPWVSMLGGGAPLVWYHWAYLAPRAKGGLSQTAIDSVYYFGFLVTIAALGVSAVTLALSGGGEPLASIAFQFGLGLLATGYAVFARMHLSSVSKLVDDASPEAVLDKYVQRSRELVTNVELASTQFAELSNSLILKSQQVAETARITTEKAMLDMARAFDQELRGTLASARHGLTEIRGLVNETSFVEERDALSRSVRETLECVTKLNAALAEFAKRAAEGAVTSEGVAISQSKLTVALKDLDQNLQRIGSDDGHLLSSSRAVIEAQEVLAGGTRALGEAVGELGDITATVSGMGLTFKNIKSLTLKANEQMVALVETSERLDDATRHFANSASTTDRLAQSVERVSAAFPHLEAGVRSLDGQLGELTSAVGNVSRDLENLPPAGREAIDLSLKLREALTAVQHVLQASEASAGQLAAHASAHSSALERGSRLAEQVGRVEEAGESIGHVLQKLGVSVETLQSRLGESAGSLSSAMAIATQSLENDVKRSGAAASLFGERLTDVAQIIIDRTQQGARLA